MVFFFKLQCYEIANLTTKRKETEEIIFTDVKLNRVNHARHGKTGMKKSNKYKYNHTPKSMQSIQLLKESFPNSKINFKKIFS